MYTHRHSRSLILRVHAEAAALRPFAGDAGCLPGVLTRRVPHEAGWLRAYVLPIHVVEACRRCRRRVRRRLARFLGRGLRAAACGSQRGRCLPPLLPCLLAGAHSMRWLQRRLPRIALVLAGPLKHLPLLAFLRLGECGTASDKTSAEQHVCVSESQQEHTLCAIPAVSGYSAALQSRLPNRQCQHEQRFCVFHAV